MYHCSRRDVSRFRATIAGVRSCVSGCFVRIALASAWTPLPGMDVIIAISVDPIPNRKSPPVLRLREASGEESRIPRKTLANLSRAPPELVCGVPAMLKGGVVVASIDQGLTIRRSLFHSDVAAALWGGPPSTPGLSSLGKVWSPRSFRTLPPVSGAGPASGGGNRVSPDPECHGRDARTAWSRSLSGIAVHGSQAPA